MAKIPPDIVFSSDVHNSPEISRASTIISLLWLRLVKHFIYLFLLFLSWLVVEPLTSPYI